MSANREFIDTAEVPHFIGHRSRLKERFIISQNNIPDYEILEMILFWAIPRRDVKDLAKKLLKEFGNIDNIIHAPEDKLLSIDGITPSVYANFRLIKEVLRRIMQNKVLGRNILASWNALEEYLRTTQGNLKTEQFRVLFLNTKNILIADELQEVGTVDETPAYPREILKRALFHEASAIILVHNHPSGNPSPSKADILLTKEIEAACNALSINLHDHVIVSSDDIYSFKSNLLL